MKTLINQFKEIQGNYASFKASEVDSIDNL